MNCGAFLVDSHFFDISSLSASFKNLRAIDWKPTWPDGSYADDNWQEVQLIVKGQKTANFEKFPGLEAIAAKFKSEIIDMMFYSLKPGGELHPHRDMVGAVGLGCLRFHIPIITNDGVDFQVDKKKVPMQPGQLWALDTSYLHSVANRGPDERVHLVLDIRVNDWARTIIPKPGIPYYLHQANLIWLACVKALRVAILEPKKLGANLKLARYVGQLLLRKVPKRT